jgi:hypothetical protein
MTKATKHGLRIKFVDVEIESIKEYFGNAQKNIVT